MIFTESKSLDEVLRYLEGKNRVFIVGCGTCSTSWRTGGEREVAAMKAFLENQGKLITGTKVVEVPCDERQDRRDLTRGVHAQEIAASDGVLVMSCGAGCGTVASVLPDKPVYPALDTMFLGRLQRLTAGDERCTLCGDCLLAWTGGICPVTICPKGLLNGACGGTTKDGKCEVDTTKECAWVAIWNRMERIGEIPKLEFYSKPKNHQRDVHPHREEKPLAPVEITPQKVEA